MSQCNNNIEINAATFYCLNEPGHEGDHHYDVYIPSSDWEGKFEYLRDELEAISMVEKDSPAALRSVLLIANEALAAAT